MRKETIDFLRQCPLEELAEVFNYILGREDCSITLASDKRGIMFEVPNKPLARFAGLNGLCIDAWIDIDVAHVVTVSCAKNGQDVDFDKTKLNTFVVVNESTKPVKKKASKA